MKVTDLSKQAYINRLNQVSKTQPIQKKTNINEGSSDKIELSPLSKEMKKYVELAKSGNQDATDKVAQIKAQMADGTYSVSSRQIAESMMKNMK